MQKLVHVDIVGRVANIVITGCVMNKNVRIRNQNGKNACGDKLNSKTQEVESTI